MSDDEHDTEHNNHDESRDESDGNCDGDEDEDEDEDEDAAVVDDDDSDRDSGDDSSREDCSVSSVSLPFVPGIYSSSRTLCDLVPPSTPHGHPDLELPGAEGTATAAAAVALDVSHFHSSQKLSDLGGDTARYRYSGGSDDSNSDRDSDSDKDSDRDSDR